MTTPTKTWPEAIEFLEEVGTWPREDQEELLRCADEIRARRAGVYRLSPEEHAGIERGLADARVGRFASDFLYRGGRRNRNSVHKACGPTTASGTRMSLKSLPAMQIAVRNTVSFWSNAIP
jgi:hypothetical protein